MASGGVRATQRTATALGELPLSKDDMIEFEGVVTEILPDGLYRVKLENDHEIIAYAAGRMKKFRIRIMTGDRVTIEMTPYDLTRAGSTIATRTSTPPWVVQPRNRRVASGGPCVANGDFPTIRRRQRADGEPDRGGIRDDARSQMKDPTTQSAFVVWACSTSRSAPPTRRASNSRRRSRLTLSPHSPVKISSACANRNRQDRRFHPADAAAFGRKRTVPAAQPAARPDPRADPSW